MMLAAATSLNNPQPSGAAAHVCVCCFTVAQQLEVPAHL